MAAGWLATNTWVRWLGAAYLLWLMSSHLTKGAGHFRVGVEDEAEIGTQPGDASDNGAGSR